MNFVISECTYFKYFVPLVKEGNERGIQSRFFIFGNHAKYNGFQIKKNYDATLEICKRYNIDLCKIEELDQHPGITFFIEGVGIDYASDIHNKISISYMTDFRDSYSEYIDKVDFVIFPSRGIAAHHKVDCDNPKNLFLGIPKYDVEIDPIEVKKKYDLITPPASRKKCLVIFPRLRDLNKIDIEKLYSFTRKLGYEVLVKTRGKDPAPDHLRGDFYFEDETWYPHTTMELIKISEFVINFSSTSIKECTILKTPVINFDIKPFDLLFPFLYDYGYVQQLEPDVEFNQFSEAVSAITDNSLDEEFDKAIDDWLFRGSASKKILDMFLHKA